MAFQLFGLTGGIASGKSTVARFLAARGVHVLDADAISREVVAPGTPGLAEIVATFGSSLLQADGSLDRKALGAVVFEDPEARRRLESITHPRIRAATLHRAQQLASAGEPFAAYEAALLVENGLADAFRPLVVVAASEAEQLARLQARDALSAHQAQARINAQMPMARKLEAADYVVDTSCPLEQVRRSTDEVLQAICKRLGVSPARFGLAT